MGCESGSKLTKVVIANRQVTIIYCLVLPFQLYGSGFGWITIPATVVGTPLPRHRPVQS